MSILATAYQKLRVEQPRPLLKGLDRWVRQLSGWKYCHTVKRNTQLANAEQIYQQSLQAQQLTDQILKQQLLQLQQLFRCRRETDQQVAESLTLLTESASRTLGMRPYPVQIYAAMLLHQGCLAEMATGEGKSLAIGLSAVLAAWSGRPCHIVTANDYLAQRDAQQFAPLYQLCNLTTGAIQDVMTAQQRQQQYQQAIVYVTGKELLADFLRDRLLLGQQKQFSQQLTRYFAAPVRPLVHGLCMRGIDTVIVDEADSILIDEATTPLIISQPRQNQPLNQACQLACKVASQLAAKSDYRIDQEHRDLQLTKTGKKKLVALSSDFPAFFKGKQRCEEMVLQALTAQEFFLRDRQYVVEEQKVVIVDEFTGRKMAQRTWRQGLQQAIEVKEGLPISDVSETLTQLSFQNFFCMFRKKSGTTGTAWEARKEFWDIYSLPVVTVPLNKPSKRGQLTAGHYRTEQEKLAAMVAETIDCHGRGQPVLIGTRSIEASERIGQRLSQAGISCQILNAIQHQKEAEIIAAAGGYQQVTVATNMAGRGADINLSAAVIALGGLHVILAERHESKRIDRQLIGRCARQGQPGTFRVYSCYEDELFTKQNFKPLRFLESSRYLSKITRLPYLTEIFSSVSQLKIQRAAQKQRRLLTKRDEWLNDMLP